MDDCKIILPFLYSALFFQNHVGNPVKQSKVSIQIDVVSMQWYNESEKKYSKKERRDIL